jgi:hypothetical protein
MPALVQRQPLVLDEVSAEALRQGEPGVHETYQRLVGGELRSIEVTLGRMQPGQKRNFYTARLAELQASWRALAGGNPGAQWAGLKLLIDGVNDLSHSVSAPSQAPTVERQDGHVPDANKNRHIDIAIDLLQVRVLPNTTKPPLSLSITGIFGPRVRQALGRFGEIADALRVLYNKPPGEGFIYDPGLPANMGALASGRGDGAVIRVAADALRGNIPPRKLACTLLHEGSHILAKDPTIDYAYRNDRALFLLTPELAYRNAASYEQVAADALGDGEHSPSWEEIEKARSKDRPVETLAAGMVRTKVTRSWVLAHNFTHPPSRQGHPELKQLLGVPARGGSQLENQVFAKLAKVAGSLMGVTSGQFAVRFGIHPGVEVRDGRTEVTVTEAERVPNIATEAIYVMCHHFERAGLAPFPPGALASFVDHPERFEWQEHRAQLSSFLEEFSAVPSKAEARDEYMRERGPDEI